MRENLQPFFGTAAALIIGSLIALVVSSESVTLGAYPVFGLVAALAFIIQWVVFVPSFVFQTEKYFDLTGSATYLSLIVLALFFGASSVVVGLESRALLISLLVSIWAVRLGTFLFQRIRRAGSDGRFDTLKTSLPWFFMTWTLQGLWVFLTLACALAAMTSNTPQALGPIAWIGALLWAVGFAIEVIADMQKTHFNNDPANAGRFINTGLWRWSRHPNYFGEILLWLGVAIIAVPVLQGWQWITIISPFFVAFLLLAISGVPLLERRAQEKWGQDPEYQAYKANTHMILLLPPGSHEQD